MDLGLTVTRSGAVYEKTTKRQNFKYCLFFSQAADSWPDYLEYTANRGGWTGKDFVYGISPLQHTGIYCGTREDCNGSCSQPGRASAEKTRQTADQVRRQAEEGIPLGRYGEPEEFGKVVAFLASDASSYLAGSTILVDGGMMKSL